MSSLQYTIDTLCAGVTVECVYQIIRTLLSEGPFTMDEILPIIQSKDRSLDLGSANIIAKAALADMAEYGEIIVEGDNVYSVD